MLRNYCRFNRYICNHVRLYMHTTPVLYQRPTSVVSREEENDSELPANLFPTLKLFNISTTGKIHNFSIDQDQIARLFNIGLLNKTMALQICHYFAYLSRDGEIQNRHYYGMKAMEMFKYLLDSRNDLVLEAQKSLITDIADTISSNCITICQRVATDLQDLTEYFSKKDFTRLMISCYKFHLWNHANALVDKYSSRKMIHTLLFDHLVEGLKTSADHYSSLNIDLSKKVELRKDIIEHLMKVCELCQRDRVQFVTKFPSEFTHALEKLDLQVIKNPKIKMSSRCVHCESILPGFDEQTLTELNTSFKNLLHSTEQGSYLYATPGDLKKFELYLTDIYHYDRKPIDLVIDGLNISYKSTAGFYYVKKSVAEDVSVTVRRRQPQAQARVLINALIRANITTRFKKVLVIGRSHMKYWSELMEFFAKHGIHFFLLSNETKDDLFQLYAATLSPKTLLMSCDFFRDHSARLGNDDKRAILERWLDTRQVWVEKKSLLPIWPTPYEKVPSADRVRGSFHVPIIDKDKLQSIAEGDPPPHSNKQLITWLCCTDTNSNHKQEE